MSSKQLIEHRLMIHVAIDITSVTIHDIDKAGIKGGDVVVNVGGKEVKNIYDYTYVLESLKVGEKVKITVMRKGKKVALEVVPGSRQ